MKATSSKDGAMRFTVKVPYRIGIEDLINAIGWSINNGRIVSDNAENLAMNVESALKQFGSRKAIFSAVTEACQSEGENYWTWSDSYSERASVQIREQARVLILKKFPDLKPIFPVA